jgi:hypothetical protein
MDKHPEIPYILKTCMFIPDEKNWKIWTDPWNTKLTFSSKNKKPFIEFNFADISEFSFPCLDLNYFNSNKQLEGFEKEIFFCVGKDSYLLEFGSYIRLTLYGQIINPLTFGLEPLCYFATKSKLPKHKKFGEVLFEEIK